MSISRRLFLRHTAAAGAVGATAAAPVMAEAATSLDPVKRVEQAQAGLVAAAKAAFPEVDDWRVIYPDDDCEGGIPYMFMIVGHNWKRKAERRAGGAA